MIWKGGKVRILLSSYCQIKQAPAQCFCTSSLVMLSSNFTLLVDKVYKSGHGPASEQPQKWKSALI